MNESDGTQTGNGGQPPTKTSLASRLFNVVAAPGEVFDEIRSNPPQTENWLIPAVLVVLVGFVGLLLCFSQPAIQQNMSDIVDQAIEKQAQRMPMNDQAREIGESMGRIMMKASMMAEPVVTAFVMPFWWGLIIWVVGAKVYKGGFSFMKGVEVAGLANVLSVLEAIVKTLLAIGLGTIFAGPHLGMLVKDFDTTKPAHMVLAAVNLFSFWGLAVRSIGMAKLGNVSFGKAAISLFGLWFIFMAIMIGFSAGMQRLGAQ